MDRGPPPPVSTAAAVKPLAKNAPAAPRVGGAVPPQPFPWPRTWRDCARSYFLSPYFQSAVQLTVGVFFLSLFVVVEKLRFAMSCQAAVIYAALVMQLSSHANMGARIMAAAVVTGMLLVGSALGGAAVSAAWAAKGAGRASLVAQVRKTLAGPPSPAKTMLLQAVAGAKAAAAGAANGAGTAAKPTLGQAATLLNKMPIVGPAYYGVLCAVAVAAMAIAAVVRCDPDTPATGALGSVLALLLGLVISNAGAVPIIGLKAFWLSAVFSAVRLGLVAVAAVLVSGTLVLPSKASAGFLATTARVLEGVGKAVSGYGARAERYHSDGGVTVVAPAAVRPKLRSLRARRHADQVAYVRAAAVARAEGKEPVQLPPPMTDAEALDALRADSQPPPAPAAGVDALRCPAPCGDAREAPVVAWRAPLNQAASELTEALFEPPFLFDAGGAPFRFKRWKAVVAQIDALISRAAALEDVVARPGYADDVAEFKRLHGDIGTAFRGATAAVAAGCAAAAAALRDPKHARAMWRAAPSGLHGRGWDALQGRLVDAARRVQASYWAAVEAGSADGSAAAITTQPQTSLMRAFHHACMLCGGLLESMQLLEAAVVDALGLPPVAADADAPVPGDVVGAAIKDAAAAMDRVAGEVVPRAVSLAPAGGGDVEAGRGDQGETGGKGEGRQALPPASAGKKEPHPYVLWTGSLLAGVTGALVWIRLGKVLFVTLPACARSRGRARDVLTSKMTVFGFKYFASLSLVLCATIILLWKFPAVLYDWQASTAFTVLAACMMPRVEETGYRAIIQALLTLLGGALGYGIMAHAPLASSGPAVVALVCAVVFLFGHMNAVAAIKQPLFLCLSTFMASLLCQFGRAGTLQYFAGRVTATAVGSVLTMLLCGAFLPYYASQECLDHLGGAMVAGAGVVRTAWEAFKAAAALERGSGGGVGMAKGSSDLTGLPKDGGPAPATPLPASADLPDLGPAISEGVNRPLGAVQALARDDRLPFRVACLPDRDLITPMPPAVPAVTAAVDGLARRLAALQLATTQEAWRGDAPELAAWAINGGAGLMGRECARAVVAAAGRAVEATLDDTEALAAACHANLKTFARLGAVLQARDAVRAAVEACEASRGRVTRDLRAALPPIIDAALRHEISPEEDLALEAWVMSFLHALDALLACGRVVESDVALKRDTYLSWLGFF